MSKSQDVVIDSEKIGNAGIIFSFTLLVLLLILWFTIKNHFWTGIISFIISVASVLGYWTYQNLTSREKGKDVT